MTTRTIAVEMIRGAYRGAFDAEPDQAGLEFWTDVAIRDRWDVYRLAEEFAKVAAKQPEQIETEPDPEPAPSGSAWADDWPTVDISKAINGYAEGMRFESIKSPGYHIILHRYVVPVNEGPKWFVRLPGQPFKEPAQRLSPEHLAMLFRPARRQ